MDPGQDLVIVGASARAAAFSALRAGLRPWFADLFGDADLAALCSGIVVPTEQYPQELATIVRDAPPGPWMYTGGLENRPRLVRQLAMRRPLWGNDADVLKQVRSPLAVRDALEQAAWPWVPPVRFEPPDGGTPERWLVKPLAGAGGTGIHFWSGVPVPPRKAVYYQCFLDGDSCSAVYVADGESCLWLGTTRQLTGERWLHAAPFHYCGSLGPMPLSEETCERFRNLGHALVQWSGLRGLFGVDCILRDGVPWPVEINPRYTASIEVLEQGTRMAPALELHARAFDPQWEPAHLVRLPVRRGWVGKAVLFARASLTFPNDGPWQRSLAGTFDPWRLPEFADIPHAGETIPAGRPVLSLFARGDSEASCLAELHTKAADLDRWLYR